MKQCPRCNKTYSDESLNYCLEDGEMLASWAHDPPPTRYVDDTPPTVLLNDVRATNPVGWPASQPSSWQPQNLQTTPFAAPAFVQPRDQTLPMIALVLGILSVIMICCYGGIWLGLPAAIIGFLGMRNADSNPGRYGGRGMAVGGLVLGVISFLGSIIFALFAIIAS